MVRCQARLSRGHRSLSIGWVAAATAPHDLALGAFQAVVCIAQDLSHAVRLAKRLSLQLWIMCRTAKALGKDNWRWYIFAAAKAGPTDAELKAEMPCVLCWPMEQPSANWQMLWKAARL